MSVCRWCMGATALIASRSIVKTFKDRSGSHVVDRSAGKFCYFRRYIFGEILYVNHVKTCGIR